MTKEERKATCKACQNIKHGVVTRAYVPHTCIDWPERPKKDARDLESRWEADQQTAHNE